MSDIKKCPKCDTENPKAANFCRKCRYEFPESTKEGLSLKPEIQYFRIKELQYVVGSTIHIEWYADNFTKIEFAGEDVTFFKEMKFLVEKTIELCLTVINDYDQAQQTLKVIPSPLPVIRSFTSSHYNVLNGKKTKISWSVEGCTQLFLRYDSEEIDVTERVDIELCPIQDTILTLVAVSIDNTVTVEKNINIKVQNEIIIKNFYSDIQHTFENHPIELYWKVDNAEKIMLYPNNIDVTNQTSLQLYPTRTTTYRLEASNALSIKEQLVTIGVKTLPRLDVKVSDSLSRLQIPSCEIDFAPLSGSIKETNIDRWLMTPVDQPITQKIWEHNILKRLKTILQKRIKL